MITAIRALNRARECGAAKVIGAKAARPAEYQTLPSGPNDPLARRRARFSFSVPSLDFKNTRPKKRPAVEEGFDARICVKFREEIAGDAFGIVIVTCAHTGRAGAHIRDGDKAQRVKIGHTFAAMAVCCTSVTVSPEASSGTGALAPLNV
ncbi:MAG: hypothetical protein WA784_17520 [Albidovulum sp.]